MSMQVSDYNLFKMSKNFFAFLTVMCSKTTQTVQMVDKIYLQKTNKAFS